MKTEINAAIKLLNDALSKAAAKNNKAAKAEVKKAIETLRPVLSSDSQGPDDTSGKLP